MGGMTMRERKVKEIIAVLAASIMFFGIFGAITYFDQPHGDIGDVIEAENVDASVTRDQGSIGDVELPEGLIVLPAGGDATLKFDVTNNDPDNDIDTIFVTIPGSEMINGTTEWYESGVEHEWDFEDMGNGEARFQAQDDFEGSEAGGSAQYDVAGNVDDALDNTDTVSEGITLTVEFTVSSVKGLKMGMDSMDLQVADMMTETPGTERSSVEPFPYPYVAAENTDNYRVIVLETPSCDLEVMYGGEQIFTSSRGYNATTSDYGFKYMTEEDHTVAILEIPEGDDRIEPIVRPREDGLQGQFTLQMFDIEVTDAEAGELEKTPIITDYQEDIPSEISSPLETDIDDDGILNRLDDDMDGDGIPNDQDDYPRIFNRIPVVVGKKENFGIKEGSSFELNVTASDPDNEDLTYNWTHDQDSEWFKMGQTITVEEDLAPGVYTFTVTITDPLGNTETAEVEVTINANSVPSIDSASADPETAEEGESVVLSVEATDEDGDELTYTWTRSDDAAWERTGSSVTLEDLEPGDYTFTVTVTDGMDETSQDITVTVEEEDDGGFPIWVIAIIAVILLIVILVVIFLVKGKGEEEEEPSTLEPETQEESAGYEEPMMEQGYQPEPEMSQEQPLYGQEEVPQETPGMEETYQQEVPVEQGVPVQEEAPVETEESLEEEESETCPECGAPLGPEDTACPSCGAEFEVAFQCPNCGAEIPEGTNQCPQCGVELEM